MALAPEERNHGRSPLLSCESIHLLPAGTHQLGDVAGGRKMLTAARARLSAQAARAGDKQLVLGAFPSPSQRATVIPSRQPQSHVITDD